jgi:hypothetical protein
MTKHIKKIKTASTDYLKSGDLSIYHRRHGSAPVLAEDWHLEFCVGLLPHSEVTVAENLDDLADYDTAADADDGFDGAAVPKLMAGQAEFDMLRSSGR